jgi:hypothetical protein
LTTTPLTPSVKTTSRRNCATFWYLVGPAACSSYLKEGGKGKGSRMV